MRRLYFLMPNVESTRSVVEEFEAEGVPDTHMHAIGSLEQPLEDLPEANLLQKTELLHGLEWGTGLGGAAGMLGGLLAVTFPPGGLVLGGGALLIGALAGAGFGGVVNTLLASHAHNHKLDRFQKAIEQGEILLMVDVPKSDVNRFQSLILGHHPEAEIGVTKPSRPS